MKTCKAIDTYGSKVFDMSCDGKTTYLLCNANPTAAAERLNSEKPAEEKDGKAEEEGKETKEEDSGGAKEEPVEEAKGTGGLAEAREVCQ